ncbi:MAG: hypothetical protein IMW96_05480 [Thermoanaerobacteraceae bacterium]|nr:hypothetical protein [Thermoanaerobacteraceae bacterium]
MGKYLLGVDVGGSGCKVSLYDREGRPVAASYRETPLAFRGGGLVEADPQEWWESCLLGIKEVLSRCSGEVAGIGVSGTNATLVVDQRGEPLYPAIMQLDLRSVKMAEEIEQRIGFTKVFEITGNRIAAGTFSLPAILWMRRNISALEAEKHTFLVPTGFIVFKLTGRRTVDYSRAATMLLFDYRQKCWDAQLMGDLGISLEELPEIHPPWEVVGGVRPEVAEQTGLKAGTPVVAGCMDTVAAMLGAGIAAKAQTLITLGTVGRVSAVTDEGKWRPEFLNCHHGVEDTWLSIALINTAGACLRWYRDLVGGDYGALNEEAAAVEAGREGLIFLPYLGGEKSPIWDVQARGIFFGLRLHHTRAHLYRAVLEGISMAIRHNLEIMARDREPSPESGLYVNGGGAASSVWLTILASVLGRPLFVLKNPETEPLGAAWLAGKGTGEGRCSLEELLHRGISFQVWPREEHKAFYDELFATYRHLYTANKDLFGRGETFPSEGRGPR